MGALGSIILAISYGLLPGKNLGIFIERQEQQLWFAFFLGSWTFSSVFSRRRIINKFMLV